ncbi:MAG TPA: dTMP kinase [Terriglobales bacterium]|nr:dTMP kinase [Terriglobales bacterium]
MAKHPSRGKFITFEGLDGCGKTTQLEKLAGLLRRQGIDVVTTREPGGTEIGERIRAVLLDSRTAGLDAHAEMALMFASRAQQIAQVILPALQAGQWVLCDRFTDSTEAYQGGGRQLGSEAVLRLHEVLCGGLWPDLTILMDTDASASVARARRRNKAAVLEYPSGDSVPEGGQPDENRFEKESRAFFERVRNAFLEIARREPQRVALVDARPPLEVVYPEIARIVRERLMATSN